MKKLKQNYNAKKSAAIDSSARSSWQNFANKTKKKKKKGFMSNMKKASIFKTPDTLDGKVGVIGSGKGVTEFQDRKRARFA